MQNEIATVNGVTVCGPQLDPRNGFEFSHTGFMLGFAAPAEDHNNDWANEGGSVLHEEQTPNPGVPTLEQSMKVVEEQLRQSRLQKRFERFHESHPRHYDRLVRLALGLKHRGIKKIGIALLYERLRWNFMLSQRADGDSFDHLTGAKKRTHLCNDYRSRYARKIMDEVPALAGFFETRGLTA